MSVKLSDHFTFSKIFLATIAPILMTIVSSVYSVVDGIFVSNFVGNTAFAAVNLAFPVIMIFSGIGTMLGSGGSAYVAKTLGEKKDDLAKEYFSFLVYFLVGLSFVIAVVAYFVMPPLLRLMASVSSQDEASLVEQATLYGRILALGLPLMMLQFLFQVFFATDEKPQLGFFFILAAGVTNSILDYVFMGPLKWGLAGAAAATLIGQAIGGLGPLLYFFINRKGLLSLGKTRWYGKMLLKAMGNGSSEFVSSIASSIVGVVYNVQLLRYAGQNGVSAYGVTMYLSYVFFAIFIGYSTGMSPAVGYHFGAGNKEELKNILRRSLLLIGIVGLTMFGLSEVLAPYLAKAFSGGNAELEALATRANRIFSFVYLTAGFSMFASGYFTALNNGTVSAVISFVRSIVFELVSVLLVPLLWQTDGIWASGPIAEIGSTAMTVFFFLKERKKYGY